MSNEMEPPPPSSYTKAMSSAVDFMASQRESPQVNLFNQAYEAFNFHHTVGNYNDLVRMYHEIRDEDITIDINDKLTTAGKKTDKIIEIIRAQKLNDNSLSTPQGGSRRRRNTKSRSKKSTRKSSRRHNKKSNRRYRKYRR